MASSSKSSVLAAIGGNTVIMFAKFGAFIVTGSGAMLSEGIHSAADVLNQTLLLIGLQRSGREADSRYAYGYGREQYIWALISAVGIFFLGCGVTLYHGVESLLHPPEQMPELTVAIAVLFGSLVIEGGVLVFALRGLMREAGDRPFFEYLKLEADPSGVAVLMEDAAACFGVLLALAGLGMAYLTGDVIWDAVATLSIGVLLGFVAIWLIARNHAVLIGPAVPEHIQARVRAILQKRDSVEEVVEMKSTVLDNRTYDIMANIEFNGEHLAERLKPGLKAAWEGIESYEDFEAFARKFADDVVGALGDEIDSLEKEIRESVPEAKYVDLETN